MPGTVTKSVITDYIDCWSWDPLNSPGKQQLALSNVYSNKNIECFNFEIQSDAT